MLNSQTIQNAISSPSEGDVEAVQYLIKRGWLDVERNIIPPVSEYDKLKRKLDLGVVFLEPTFIYTNMTGIYAAGHSFWSAHYYWSFEEIRHAPLCEWETYLDLFLTSKAWMISNPEQAARDIRSIINGKTTRIYNAENGSLAWATERKDALQWAIHFWQWTVPEPDNQLLRHVDTFIICQD